MRSVRQQSSRCTSGELRTCPSLQQNVWAWLIAIYCHWKTADQLFYLELQQTCLVRLAPALNMHVISISYETQLFPSFPFPRTLFLTDIRSDSMLSLLFYSLFVFFLCFSCRIFLIWFDFIGCSASVSPEDASLSLIAVSRLNWQIYHFIGPFRGICTIFLLSQLHQW